MSQATALGARINELVEKLGNISNFLAEISYLLSKLVSLLGSNYFQAPAWEVRDVFNRLVMKVFIGLEKKLQEDPGLFLLKTSEIVQVMNLSLKFNGEYNYAKLFSTCFSIIENRPIEYLSGEVVSQLLELGAEGKVKLTAKMADKLERNCLEHLPASSNIRFAYNYLFGLSNSSLPLQKMKNVCYAL